DSPVTWEAPVTTGAPETTLTPWRETRRATLTPISALTLGGAEGIPPESPRPRKVAIVGGGPTRRYAPYRDESWEIWAFSSRRSRYPRVTRWFEIHSMT